MMKRQIGYLFLVLSSWASIATAHAGGFTKENYKRWVEMRVGSGEPVYWYSTGTIRAYPGGELIATMEGYDTARLDLASSTDTKAVQLSRKTYVYRDADTGDIMKTPSGDEVAAIAYPYQLITYELKGDILETYVEQGSGVRLQKIGPGTDIEAKELKGGVLFSAPLFLDLETPRGRYQTFENYDFFDPNGNGGSDGFITFVRYGDAPSWTDAEKIVMHLTTWRIDQYEDVPASFREWVDENASLWKEPPADMSEIELLQADE